MTCGEERRPTQVIRLRRIRASILQARTAGVGTGYGVNTGASGFGFMCVEITGVFPTNNGLGNCGKNGIRGPQYQLDFTDKVSYLHGNHAFKFGVEQVFVKFDDSSTASQNGIVSFTWPGRIF